MGSASWYQRPSFRFWPSCFLRSPIVLAASLKTNHPSSFLCRPFILMFRPVSAEAQFFFFFLAVTFFLFSLSLLSSSLFSTSFRWWCNLGFSLADDKSYRSGFLGDLTSPHALSSFSFTSHFGACVSTRTVVRSLLHNNRLWIVTSRCHRPERTRERTCFVDAASIYRPPGVYKYIYGCCR